MHLIKLSDLVILPERQRQEFDPQALMELAESIRYLGLMHPPVIREVGADKILVAGERRIKAMQLCWDLGDPVIFDNRHVPEGQIPYTTLGELAPLEAEEAELDENLKRRDLTWQEHAAAVERLHNLRMKQAQATAENLQVKGLTAEAAATPAHTVAATALEVTGRSDGYYQDMTRKEILVARHLDNPDVVKAKNVDEAFKILKRAEERQRNVELAAAIGATFSAASHAHYNIDCRAFMKQPENKGRFDVILTDPPYGMGADEFGDSAGRMETIDHKYDDSLAAWLELMEEWTKLSFEVTKPQAHAYVFCDIDNFHALKIMMEIAGWYVFRTPLIVHKLNSGRVPLPDRGPRRQWEAILYAIKGNKPVTHIYPDVVSVTGDDNLGHGAQKPVALYQNLLQRSVRPGDTVFDPFAGTGTIFPAAHTYKVTAIACERSPEYYALGLKRMQALDDQGELPL